MITINDSIDSYTHTLKWHTWMKTWKNGWFSLPFSNRSYNRENKQKNFAWEMVKRLKLFHLEAE